MSKTIKDGWHIIAGYKVYVEKGCVMHGLTHDANECGTHCDELNA